MVFIFVTGFKLLQHVLHKKRDKRLVGADSTTVRRVNISVRAKVFCDLKSLTVLCLVRSFLYIV